MPVPDIRRKAGISQATGFLPSDQQRRLKQRKNGNAWRINQRAVGIGRLSDADLYLEGCLLSIMLESSRIQRLFCIALGRSQCDAGGGKTLCDNNLQSRGR
jgi:hypothetical protein